MHRQIDLNCDMGEGFGAYMMGADHDMLSVASTANLACGFHGGDPTIMATLCEAALRYDVAVGAHPGYPDLWGFGRREIPFSREDRQRIVAYQVGAAMAMAKLVGHRLTHVKAHGALGHLVADNEEAATDYVKTVKKLDPEFYVPVMAGTLLEQVVLDSGLRVSREIYADRAYTEEGRLVSRNRPGAVLHDPDVVSERVATMLSGNCIVTESGKRIPVEIDSVCVHGDSPDALAMALAVRNRLVNDGWTIRPFAQNVQKTPTLS